MDITGNLSEFITEELQCKTVFTIPILGGIAVKESTVVTWIIMAVLVALSLWLTHDMKVTGISKRQAFAEFAVTKLQNMITDMIGENGKEYVPYLMTVIIYIGFANMIGLLGFKSPTKDINVTAALAIMSIVLIEAAGIRAKGTKKWLKSFTEPIGIITPINILEIFIRPLSLCMRLFGNVLGAFVIMKLIEHVCGLILPLVLSAYFDVFDGLIQAYVFVFLTSLFIKEAIE